MVLVVVVVVIVVGVAHAGQARPTRLAPQLQFVVGRQAGPLCASGLVQLFELLAGLSKAFMKRLADTNILMEADVKAEMPDGRSFQWRGFWIVDEKLFRTLPEATVKEWWFGGSLRTPPQPIGYG